MLDQLQQLRSEGGHNFCYPQALLSPILTLLLDGWSVEYWNYLKCKRLNCLCADFYVDVV
jgi:hypothetical protein